MKNVILFLLICIVKLGTCQVDTISENLTVEQISESVWLHSENNNNGIVYLSDNEAIIVSTPSSDTETRNLIDWVRKDKKSEIVGYVIDRWHPDAMEGLDVVLNKHIKTYANNRTIEIAKQKELPIAQTRFDSTLTLAVGEKIVECHYFGPSHTTDGIVVYLPEENLLFGGNGIRNKDGWVGNIWDADLHEWTNTTKKLKEAFNNLKIVVPGHGPIGDSSLIDYTIQLYDKPLNRPDSILTNKHSLELTDTVGSVLIAHHSKEIQEDNVIYDSGIVSLISADRELKIKSNNEIIFYKNRNYFKIADGYVSIVSDSSVSQFYFEELYFFIEHPTVEFALVIKSIKD